MCKAGKGVCFSRRCTHQPKAAGIPKNQVNTVPLKRLLKLQHLTVKERRLVNHLTMNPE